MVKLIQKFSICILMLLPPSTYTLAQRVIPLETVHAIQCGAFYHDTIPSAPPFSLNMPMEVIYTYIAFDSLCKLSESIDNISELAKDSLTLSYIQNLNKYIYLTIDYNPFVFNNYLNAGYYLNGQYKNRPIDIYNAYKTISHEKLGDKNLENMVTFADGIYEIEITDIWIDSSFNYNQTDPYRLRDVVCMSGLVRDVIKGGYWCAHACEEAGESCMSFSYLRSATTFRPNTLGGSGVSELFFDLDSVGVDSTGDVIYQEHINVNSNIYGVVHDPGIGSRYILFAKLWSYYYKTSDGSPYYIVPLSSYQREGGLFEINSGILHDSNNYFGLGENISIEQFKDWLRSYIASLTN